LLELWYILSGKIQTSSKTTFSEQNQPKQKKTSNETKKKEKCIKICNKKMINHTMNEWRRMRPVLLSKSNFMRDMKSQKSLL